MPISLFVIMCIAIFCIVYAVWLAYEMGQAVGQSKTDRSIENELIRSQILVFKREAKKQESKRQRAKAQKRKQGKFA